MKSASPHGIQIVLPAKITGVVLFSDFLSYLRGANLPQRAIGSKAAVN
jgi:hypothetical protein